MDTIDASALLIEPKTLESQLDDPNVRIVQVCSKERFDEGHIPGSYWLPPQALVLGQPPLPGMTPPLSQINSLLHDLQITPQTFVVALDDEGGGWAGRFLWTLAMVGHTKFALLNGGLWGWSGDGFALTTMPTSTPQSTASITPLTQHQWSWAEEQPAIDAQTIVSHLKDSQWVVWDARSLAEHQGHKKISLRGGHIPGAVHYEWTQAMDRHNNLKLRDLNTLTSELNALGIDKTKTIVTHCQGHHRSGFTWILGRILGLNILAYPGAWAEWGNNQELPIETNAN